MCQGQIENTIPDNSHGLVFRHIFININIILLAKYKFAWPNILSIYKSGGTSIKTIESGFSVYLYKCE